MSEPTPGDRYGRDTPGDRYGRDVLAGRRPDGRRPPRPVRTAVAEPGLVVEDGAGTFCGAVLDCTAAAVTLEDSRGRRRVFPLIPAGFLLEGEPATLTRPVRTPVAVRRRTASGSVALAPGRARVARAARIYVEGIHDAALVERVWGEDLRIEGVVVEPLHGLDDLPAVIADFRPGPRRRLGVLVDHLVPGSKESRIVASVRHPDVLVTGHPYVDVWQAVRPASVGIAAWPVVPPGQPWKEGVCTALGEPDVRQMWRRVLAGVNTFADLETPLLTAMEALIDFVSPPDGPED